MWHLCCLRWSSSCWCCPRFYGRFAGRMHCMSSDIHGEVAELHNVSDVVSYGFPLVEHVEHWLLRCRWGWFGWWSLWLCFLYQDWVVDQCPWPWIADCFFSALSLWSSNVEKTNRLTFGTPREKATIPSYVICESYIVILLPPDSAFEVFWRKAMQTSCCFPWSWYCSWLHGVGVSTFRRSASPWRWRRTRLGHVQGAIFKGEIGEIGRHLSICRYFDEYRPIDQRITDHRISAFRNWAAWEGFNAVMDLPFVVLGLASLGNQPVDAQLSNFADWIGRLSLKMDVCQTSFVTHQMCPLPRSAVIPTRIKAELFRCLRICRGVSKSL